jgi:hypothetical protein
MAADNAMTRRIHSYGTDSQYAMNLEEYDPMSDTWTSIKERVLSAEPITVRKNYREIYTASLTMDNIDGLLTPQNRASAYNLDGETYDALLDEARKVRLKQGVYCYEMVSYHKTVTANIAPTAGDLLLLTDIIEADVTDKADGYWVHWSAVGADAELILTLDLTAAMNVEHGAITFLSKSGEATQIMLPSSVKFEYSADNLAWFDCASDVFKMRPGTLVNGEAEAEYTDSRGGQRYVAWFNDLHESAQYIRATITNIAEVNEIYIDEFYVWGGADQHIEYKTTLTGYLGDSIVADNATGNIQVDFQDVRKRESDNRRVELTLEYKNKRPEQIIYDLLTSRYYWGDTKLLNKNPSFEDNSAWVYGSDDQEAAIRRTYNPKSGNYFCHMDYNGVWVRQDDVPIIPGIDYIFDVWAYGILGGMTWTLTVTPDVGTAHTYGPIASTGDWQLLSTQFEAPAGSSKCTIKVKAIGSHANSSQNDGVDDIYFYEYSEAIAGYGEPIDSAEIGWTQNENLSGFVIPKWQGQQGTILDYITELAQLVGWVYDADGDGIRQFWEPESVRDTASDYLNYFGDRWGRRATPERTKTGKDIRNYIKIVGYEGTSMKSVTREYRHQASIDRYGTRYARITEPLVKNATISDQLGKSILRDFAYANDGVSAGTYGDFDVDRPCRICTFHEPIRAFLDKNELWVIEGCETEMTTAGKGSYNAQLTCRQFVSSGSGTVASVVGTGGATKIDVSWTANSEIDVDGYYVYWSTSPAGTFTKRAKVTSTADSITGLTDGAGYWIYVTAVNITGNETEKSGIIYCKAGVGNSGDDESTWGIPALAASIVGDGTDATLSLTYTPDIFWTPDYMMVSLLGPDIDATPTTETLQTKITPVDGVAEVWEKVYTQTDKASGDTLYMRFAVNEVVIADIHYKLAVPILSNVVSVVWP